MKRNILTAKLALVLPGLILIASLCLLIIINLIFNPTFWMKPDSEAVYATPVAITIINGVLIVTGAIGLITLVPSTITGVILLKKK